MSPNSQDGGSNNYSITNNSVNVTVTENVTISNSTASGDMTVTDNTYITGGLTGGVIVSSDGTGQATNDTPAIFNPQMQTDAAGSTTMAPPQPLPASGDLSNPSMGDWVPVDAVGSGPMGFTSVPTSSFGGSQSTLVMAPLAPTTSGGWVSVDGSSVPMDYGPAPNMMTDPASAGSAGWVPVDMTGGSQSQNMMDASISSNAVVSGWLPVGSGYSGANYGTANTTLTAAAATSWTTVESDPSTLVITSVDPTTGTDSVVVETDLTADADSAGGYNPSGYDGAGWGDEDYDDY
jgi:hypothetical protein